MWPENVDKSQLEITFSRGSGKGGQKRNKTSTKCRMVHIPTGIAVECDETRSSHQNRKIAFNKLAAQLIPLMKKQIKLVRFRANLERIRTYHEPDNRVIDDRVPNKQWPFDTVMEGKAFEEILNAVLLEQRSAELRPETL